MGNKKMTTQIKKDYSSMLSGSKTLICAFLSLFFFICILPGTALSGDMQHINYNADGLWNWVDKDDSKKGTELSVLPSSVTITASGKDVWTNADEYAAYYMKDVNGNFEAVVKVESQENTDAHAKAGIMIKNTLSRTTKDDRYCIIAVTPGAGVKFEWDSDNDDNGMLDSSSSIATAGTAPIWLKLKKQYGTYTGYYSTDGETWNVVGSVYFNDADNIQDLGLFVTSHSSGNLCTTNFGTFLIDNAPLADTYTITASAGENGAISESGSVEVAAEDDEIFTIVPDPGYMVDTVKIDGTETALTEPNQYTFSNVTADHSIEVTFTEIICTIKAYSGANGTISPLGSTIVPYEGSQIYTVTPNEGYAVENVFVDGSSVELTNAKYTFTNVIKSYVIEVSFVSTTPSSGDDTGIAGCSTNTSEDYNEGFDAEKFDMTNISVTDGQMVLDTGNDAIDPDNIIIPFEQDVSVTFLYENAGWVSDFGYILKSDAVDQDGNYLGWNNIPQTSKHPIFRNIQDDYEQSGGNGILDSDSGSGSMPTSNEENLAAYDDGTGLKFAVNSDGILSPKDMKKNLGTFAAGSEIVFFLTANKDWNTTDTSSVFFTKKEFNPDTYGACVPSPDSTYKYGQTPFEKPYYLGSPQTSTTCYAYGGGWLDQGAINRIDSTFGITISGTYNLPVTYGQKFSHVIIGAPPDDPNQWILGWDDTGGGGDADHNDLVFKIERRTGGVAQLKSTDAIEPEDPDSYYTAVTFEVWDSMPCSGKTEIKYFVSIDNGVNWVEITNWDIVYQSDALKTTGTELPDWTPGTPQYTHRSIRIDFAGRDLYGRAIVWKAELYSEDPLCSPGILDVAIEGNVSTNGEFSRAAPIVLANVLYSGFYETPSINWGEKVQRGHLTATRLYKPEAPSDGKAELQLWDSGSNLSNMATPASRKIYTPSIITTEITNELINTGDGTETTFTGILANHPVSALTVRISDQTELFTDRHTEDLVGSLGGTGTINRFTGEYSITFNTPPANGTQIKVNYTYYTTSSTLLEFTTSNIDSDDLGLDDTYIIGDGFRYDFNGDNKYNGVDHYGTGTEDDSDADWLVNWIRGFTDGSSTKKEWILGPIDHSVPAAMTPPGKPSWYYGSDISSSEKNSFDLFRDQYSTRQTVIFVGARDGMLHAFDAGKFRWGDNPQTDSIYENRGYFLWDEYGDPQYGSGAELWSFIPANLIPRLKNNRLSGDDRAYVDASPTLADVYVDVNDGNGKKWRTLLLAAEGNGGDTVFCLDVTNPYSPFFVWEFSDPDLFRSRSSPAVAQIGMIVDNGETKWVAFFVSGKSYDNTVYPSIYMIDVSNGNVIRRIELDAVAGGKGGVPSGQPAVIDSDGNGFIDRIYIGTDKGYMYKVNIPDNPNQLDYSLNHCVINTDFTVNDGESNEKSVDEDQRYHPIYSSPVVIVERAATEAGVITSSVKIFFGTGDSPYYDENINTSDTTYHFFAYVDETDKGNNDPDDVYLDWFYPLEAGHRVFASAFAAAGTIYFGTSTAETEDPCDPSNEGDLIALQIEDGSVVEKISTGNIYTSPIVDDKHLYIKTPDGLKSFGDDTYNNPVNVQGESSVTTKMWREVFDANSSTGSN